MGGGRAARLVVINDGSRDNTYALMQRAALTRPLLIVLNKENGGHGDSVLYGYQYAVSHGADYIFQTDSDGQTDPDEFEAFWEKRNDYTGIFGDRSDRQDGIGRILIEKTLLFLLFLFFHVKIPDANAPFRLMKAECVKKYMELIPAHYNLPNVMLTVFFTHYGEKIAFRHISFKPRQGGENSINIPKIWGIGWKSIRDFWKIRKKLYSKEKV